ncbi:hypothetical protein ANCCAN_22199 [Ancylostoma caninum]|uniref:Major facilitator superfamily (MFS) profile domain-containing protein n=1 Tax=Ancylostoma caninum TaxID=29170 RepID=A0A368FIL9_ANCCA|nr:hypothetical protein ANCCAN_22199 [Ancylostoma caninum]
MNRYGRRIVVASSHLAAAAIFFALVFSPEDAGVRTALWALGKFAISCSFMSIYVYASEIFPTNIRNLSIGFCEMMSRVGGILAPYVVVLVSASGIRSDIPHPADAGAITDITDRRRVVVYTARDAQPSTSIHNKGILSATMMTECTFGKCKKLPVTLPVVLGAGFA